MSMSFQKVIKEAKQGKRSAQKEIYIQYSKYLMCVVKRYVNDDDYLSQDIMHDGFIKIFKNIKSFEGSESGLKAWMSRIIINEALQHHRRKNKIIFISHTHEQRTEDISLDPEIFNFLEAEEILDCINELSETLKVTFYMYFIDGYKHKEIAELLNITKQVSRTRLNRAKVQLKQIFLEKEIGSHAR